MKPSRKTTMIAEPEAETTTAPETAPWRTTLTPERCPQCGSTEAIDFRPNGNRLDYDGKLIEWGMAVCADDGCRHLRIAKRERPVR
jgi:hypothetical protein